MRMFLQHMFRHRRYENFGINLRKLTHQSNLWLAHFHKFLLEIFHNLWLAIFLI